MDDTLRTYYDRRATEYDDAWSASGRWKLTPDARAAFDEEVAALVGFVSELSPARTLDAGCGTGFLTQHLQGGVVGLDQSAAMLTVARARAPHVRFVQGDAMNLPFRDGEFERLFTSFVYCHLDAPQRERFLAEARRVAAEIVAVAGLVRPALSSERWEERVLNDGSHWRVYRRYFVPEGLAAELRGEVIHRGSRWFVVVRA